MGSIDGNNGYKLQKDATKFIVILIAVILLYYESSSVKKYLLKNNLQVEKTFQEISNIINGTKDTNGLTIHFLQKQYNAQYFEYEDHRYNNTKHCLQQILDVDNVENYVQQIEDYNRKNKDT